MTNRTTLECVREFHEAYGVVNKDAPDISDEGINNLRLSLLQEELDELRDALANNDIVEVLDALSDLQYILDGSYLSWGLGDLKEAAFNEVHRSNMSKLGEDGKPIYREGDGKVLKGPNYTPPDLAQFFEDKKDKAA